MYVCSGRWIDWCERTAVGVYSFAQNVGIVLRTDPIPARKIHSRRHHHQTSFVSFRLLMWLLLWLLLRSHLTRKGFGHIEKGYRCGEFGHLAEVERVVGLEVDLLQWGRHLPSLR